MVVYSINGQMVFKLLVISMLLKRSGPQQIPKAYHQINILTTFSPSQRAACFSTALAILKKHKTLILSITFNLLYPEPHDHVRVQSPKICHISGLVVCKDTIYFALLLKSCTYTCTVFTTIILLSARLIRCLNRKRSIFVT